jgi:Ca2+-dependent lipid-binding protein
MTTKAKAHALNGMHTAGIFSDMSIDGPEIGTLVLVVDRAKNLPNRKTIGKQDPYCAARLGKEAKKTTTDIRGGQTPKWQVMADYPSCSLSTNRGTRLQGPGTQIHRPRLARLLPA